MKRWFAVLAIAGYLGSLCAGLACHTLSTGAARHPAMYYVVWDMFCGWGSYSTRVHMVAEGASGTYYELTPSPWGDFNPYGSLARINYDRVGIYLPKFAGNVLRHTKHEPITQVFVIEELWPKKYNLRDDVWTRVHGGQKDVHSYYNLWAVLNADGQPSQVYPNWMSKQSIFSISNNPRLHAEASRSRSFFTNSSKPSGRMGPRAFIPPTARSLNFQPPLDRLSTTADAQATLPLQGEVALPEQTELRAPLGN